MSAAHNNAVLGLSGYHPDASACLVVDGTPVSLDREDSYSGIARDPSLPLRAARRGLERAGLKGSDLGAVVFHEKPLRRFERSLVDRLSKFPRESGGFAAGMSRWLGDRLWMRDRLAGELGIDPKRVRFMGHMEAHATAAAWATEEAEAAILVMDDVGESAGTALAITKGGIVSLLREQHAPATLGLILAATCRYLGLDAAHHAHRLRDLAAAAGSRDASAHRDAFQGDSVGALKISEGAFEAVGRTLSMRPSYWSPRYGPPRDSSTPVDPSVDPRAAQMAHDVLCAVGSAAADHARALARMTGLPTVALGGICARQPLIVEAIRASGAFRRIHVAPLCGDDGTALGAAIGTYRQLFGPTRPWDASKPLFGMALSTPQTSGPISGSTKDICSTAPLAAALCDGSTVGFVQGGAPAQRWGQLGRLAIVLPTLESQTPLADAQAALFGVLKGEPQWSRPRLILRPEDEKRWGSIMPDTAGSSRWTWTRLRPSSELCSLLPDALENDGTLQAQFVSSEGNSALHDLLGSLPALGRPPIAWCANFERPEGTCILSMEHAQDAYQRAGLDALWVNGVTQTLEPVHP